MKRKGKFTRGPVEAVYSDKGEYGYRFFLFCPNSGALGYSYAPDKWEDVYGGIEDSYRAVSFKDEDASLIATAFNAATACEDMGYDGEACVKALPELVKILEWAMPFTPNDGTIRTNALDIMAKCRG